MKTSEDRSAKLAVTVFPVAILVGITIAYFFPAPFLPLADYITYFLMLILFAMGLTLTIPDFQEIARRPWPIFLGVIGQFVIMPLFAVGVAKLFDLDSALAVGLLMLGSVSGGTASNVIAYLARGDVALSVAMTSVSTLVSPIVTPLLMLALAGEDIAVDGAGMAQTLVQTVLLPVLGMCWDILLANYWACRSRITAPSPSKSVASNQAWPRRCRQNFSVQKPRYQVW